uniref:nucleoside diphosphate-linked moiety X motif 19-like isoform X4 n=1 Tax=Ciona intestinalis TaxID=7719 RepID=UPI000EF52FD4|nr:nucleoside diphosphate-linked moiety X motif 19-like isoform X4 [Ciona intestinalis]|eukprot:XP_026693999.1 nucleoside diphosphate-linked moiety X motif 19-like isoform X4 [Ciona intestinalis]
MLKRSSKASFFPNAYVFPGGNIDKADSSFRWFSVFHLLTRNVESLGQNFIVHQHDEMRSPMFKNGKNNVNSGLPNEISLRISAIRETFEETGILIAHSTHENSMSPLPENNWYCSVIEWDHAEVEIWRSKWESPSTTLLSYHNQKIILAPPQVYELGRLLNFKQHQVLARFTSKRRLKGLSRWLPVRAQSTDGVLMSLLPDTTEKPPNERSTEKVKRCKFDTLSSDEKSDNEDQSETVSPVPQSTRTTMQQPWLQAKHKVKFFNQDRTKHKVTILSRVGKATLKYEYFYNIEYNLICLMRFVANTGE